MRKGTLLLFVLLLLLAGTPSGGQDCPGCEVEEPDPGTGCVECILADDESAECGEPVEWGSASSWACVGGYKCYRTATGSYCKPNCGNRCYSI